MIHKYKVLLNELVSVSFKDQVLGSIPKWDAHLNSYILSEKSLPHRAFSIFLFNSQNQLLFQRRSPEKKTFPLCWTNTCCSHPNMIKYEESKEKGVQNIRDSLHRALERQLKLNLKNESFFLVDKILYKAKGREQQQFGQYELDYVYLCKLNIKNLEFTAVPEQVCQTAWVTKQNLKDFVETKQGKEGCYFSPWFMKMYQDKLIYKWWQMAIENKLKNLGTQQKMQIKNL